MKKLLFLMGLLLMAAVVSAPPAALATATLYLDDGAGHVVTITDGQIGVDVNPSAGVVTYIGTIGVWTINVSTGISFSPGSLNSWNLDLNSVNTSSAAGSLNIMFSDTGFSAPTGNGQATMAIGGTTDGSVEYSAYFNNANVLGIPPPVSGTIIGSSGPFGTTVFSSISTSNVFTDPPISLTEVVNITHNYAGTTSFDAELGLVPLPPSALLLGTGLLGLVGLRRFWKANQG